MEAGVRRVTLLLSRNGTLVLVPEEGLGGSSLSGLTALLGITFAGGLALNALLAAALLTCAPHGPPRSRARPAQAMLVTANALDCILNVPAAATVVSSWTALVEGAPSAAEALCKFSATTSQLTSILQTLSMLVVVLDRCLSLATPSTSSSFSLTPGGSKRGTRRWGSLLARAILWASIPASIAISAPIGVLAHTRVFPTRYGCGMVRLRGSGLGLAGSVLAFGYLLPWLIQALVVSVAARRAQQQRWRRRQLELAAQQQGRHSTQAGSFGALTFSAVETPLGHLSVDEYRALLLAGVLLFLYIVMLIPGILATQVLQLASLTPTASSGPETLWPVWTGTYETVLVWLRFQFAVVAPGAIAILDKDVRQRVLAMVQCLCQACCCCCCRRDNAVGHAEGTVVGAATTSRHRYRRTASKDRWTDLRRQGGELLLSAGDFETTVSPGTAVLFATSQGMHLRTCDPTWWAGDSAEDADDVSSSVGGSGPHPGAGSGAGSSGTGRWANDSQPRYVFQFCDLAIIEDPVKLSPEASTARVGISHNRDAGRLVAQGEDVGPSMTREELQASLGKSRSLVSSSRKNVRFASVVSEIPPVPVAPGALLSTSLPRVTEDPDQGVGTDSPVRYTAAKIRTRTLEMMIVNGEETTEGIDSTTFVATPPKTPTTPSDATFSLPPKSKLFLNMNKV